MLVLLLISLIGCTLIHDDSFSFIKNIYLKRNLNNNYIKEFFSNPWVAFTSGIIILFTFSLPYNFYSQAYKNVVPIRFFEGRSGIVTAIPHANKNYVKLLESRRDSGRANLIEPGAAHIYNLSGLMAIDSEFRPTKMMQIGIGSGLFHFFVKDLPNFEKIDVVEISEEMIKAWKSISKPSSLGKSFDHKNVDLHIMDGRRFLRRAMANGEKYDLIQIGVQHPNSSGASNIYTKEMFEMVKQVLKPDGYLALICYTGIARTALESFQNVFWIGDKASKWVFLTNKSLNKISNKKSYIDAEIGNLYKSQNLNDMKKKIGLILLVKIYLTNQ